MQLAQAAHLVAKKCTLDISEKASQA